MVHGVWLEGGSRLSGGTRATVSVLSGAGETIRYAAKNPGVAGNAITLTYVNPGAAGVLSVAVATSLGTVFFLFLGVFICMMLIIESRSSFFQQMTSFLVLILGGSMGLWATLTHRNPSSALTASAFALPFATLLLVGLVVLQICLGGLTILTSRNLLIDVGHLGGGALMLATSVVLALRVYRPFFAAG